MSAQTSLAIKATRDARKDDIPDATFNCSNGATPHNYSELFKTWR